MRFEQYSDSPLNKTRGLVDPLEKKAALWLLSWLLREILDDFFDRSFEMFWDFYTLYDTD